MKTSSETVDRISAVLSAAGTVRTRNMMGGHLVYLDTVLIGQINQSVLFIKITENNKAYSAKFASVSPYPGAKPAYQVADKMLSATDWFIDFLHITQKDLSK